jgi:hypothetical protein
MRTPIARQPSTIAPLFVDKKVSTEVMQTDFRAAAKAPSRQHTAIRRLDQPQKL